MFTSFYIIFIINIDPHTDRIKRRVEIFNEFVILIVGYHLFTFTNFVLDGMKQFEMGYSLVIFISLTFVSNIVNMVIKNVRKLRQKLRLKQQKENFKYYKEDILRKEHINRLFLKKVRSTNLMEEFHK